MNHDDVLDKRELLRFRYALMPLEHCAGPFFTRCGAMIKGDHERDAKEITKEEWMKCLKVRGYIIILSIHYVTTSRPSLTTTFCLVVGDR